MSANDIYSIVIDDHVAYYLLKNAAVRSVFNTEGGIFVMLNTKKGMIYNEYSCNNGGEYRTGYILKKCIELKLTISDLISCPILASHKDQLYNHMLNYDKNKVEEKGGDGRIVDGDFMNRLKKRIPDALLQGYLPSIVLTANGKYSDKRMNYDYVIPNNKLYGDVDIFRSEIIKNEYTFSEFIDILEITGGNLTSIVKNFADNY